MKSGVREAIELRKESLFHQLLGELGLFGGEESKKLVRVNMLKESASQKKDKTLERPVCGGVVWGLCFVVINMPPVNCVKLF